MAVFIWRLYSETEANAGKSKSELDSWLRELLNFDLKGLMSEIRMVNSE